MADNLALVIIGFSVGVPVGLLIARYIDLQEAREELRRAKEERTRG